MRSIVFSILLFCHVLVVGPVAMAQPAQGASSEKDHGWEFGAHLGTVLPDQVEGVSEIFYSSGFYAGYPIGDSDIAFWEGGITTGDDEGVKWSQGVLGARVGVPIDSLLGIVFIGLDGTQYEASGVAVKLHLGTHVGGGFMTQLAGNLWLRTDMRMVFNPGATMHINLGFVFRFPRSGGGGGN